MSAPRPSPRLDGCARCGATTFVRVAPVREHGKGGAPAPMAVRWIDRPRDLGPFARAVSCVGPKLAPTPGCGLTDWTARGIEALRADEAAGVALVEAGAQEGPYR